MNVFALLLRTSRSLFSLAVGLGCLSGASGAGLIAIISQALEQLEPAALSTWTFVGLAAITIVSGVSARIVVIRLSQNAVYRMQLQLSRQILEADLRVIEDIGAAPLLANLTEDIQVISNAVFVLPALFISLAVVVGCFIYMVWLSWTLFAVVMILACLAISSCGFILKQARQQLAKAREEQDQLFKHFRAITEGIKDLKLNYTKRQAFLTEDLQSSAAQFRQQSIVGLVLISTTDSWGKLIFFLAVGVLLFGLPSNFQLDLSQLTSYILTFTYLLAPMESIVNKLPFISKATVALNKIEALSQRLSKQVETITAPPPCKQWHVLELQDLKHTYYTEQADQAFTLGPINLCLQPGEIIFIVGGNGSGKSTLAKLITGLYVPDHGLICLDGQPITADNREWYRQHFTAIFADFFLFDRLMGFEPTEVETQVQSYLRDLHLDQKVSIKSGQLSTTALSQGQRKRLALLTAYLENRSIYVFDEWAADQDPTFKQVFYTQIITSLKQQGKTVIVISHDDRYFEVADRLVKLDYGQIVLNEDC